MKVREGWYQPSSQAKRRNYSPARSLLLLTRIRWINRRPDQPDGCLQTGKYRFTNRGRAAIRRAIRLPRSDFAMIAPQYTNSTIRVNVRLHAQCADECPLLGVERTSLKSILMSADDP